MRTGKDLVLCVSLSRLLETHALRKRPETEGTAGALPAANTTGFHLARTFGQLLATLWSCWLPIDPFRTGADRRFQPGSGLTRS